MFRILHRFLIFILLSICFFSCKQSPPTRLELLTGDGKSMFRSIQFDMDLVSVKNKETESLVSSAKDYLRYEIREVFNNTNEYIEIEYLFDKDRLDRIMVYHALENKEEVASLLHDLHAHFTNRFGKGINNEFGWMTWEFEDNNGLPGVIEIMINGNSNQGDHGVDIEMVKYYKDDIRKPVSLYN